MVSPPRQRAHKEKKKQTFAKPLKESGGPFSIHFIGYPSPPTALKTSQPNGHDWQASILKQILPFVGSVHCLIVE